MPPRLQHLQTRLTVLYAAMFGIVLVVVCGLTWAAVSEQARRTVLTNLSVTGGVYDRIWKERADRVRGGAEVLAKDYGFRAALASHDAPTITSAVENLRARLRLDAAFVVSAGGALMDAAAAPAFAPSVVMTLAQTGDAQGVLASAGAPYEIVSAPIYTPQLQGWVVFGMRLDAANLASLGTLSAIPLTAEVVQGGPNRWRAADGSAPTLRFPYGAAAPGYLQGPRGREYALLRPLEAPAGAPPAALLLHYPEDAALAPYRVMLGMIFGVGLLGMTFVVTGSWALARSITRPIAALATAARRLRDGDVAHVDVQAGVGEVGILAGCFNAMADAVAEREARILQSALGDQDTGLPNRRGLEQLVSKRCKAAPEHRLVAATFGVDRYARMRGVLGFELAVEVMTRLADRLRALEPDWLVGRTASDTLTAVMTASDVDVAAARVEAARRVLEATVPVCGHLIDVRVTTGLGFDLSRELIRDAELALDAARAAGSRRARFDNLARARAADSLALMPELRQAMAGGGLTLAHQPKWDVRQAAVTGVECLIRWTHPERGLVPPDAFIGLAEATGDIRALTDWVVARAVAEQADLAARGHAIAFSLNLSGVLVGDAQYTEGLLDALARASGPICVEITETAVISDPKTAMATFAALREAGVGVSIDDYGSGLSSLAYLKQIAATELKLDRSLVVDVSRSARDALLIRSTVDLAHGLGMKVVAEGVEDATSMALLAGLGCDYIQGWHVARPMPLAELAAYLQGLAAGDDRAGAAEVASALA